MRMKRNSNNSKDTMDFIELSSDTTRFRKEDQYLKNQTRINVRGFFDYLCKGTTTILC